MAATKVAVQAAAGESRAQLRERIDQARQGDARAAASDAAWAEAKAADALDFADWAVDNAQLAMLDAVDARAYADELARAAAS